MSSEAWIFFKAFYCCFHCYFDSLCSFRKLLIPHLHSIENIYSWLPFKQIVFSRTVYAKENWFLWRTYWSWIPLKGMLLTSWLKLQFSRISVTLSLSAKNLILLALFSFSFARHYSRQVEKANRLEDWNAANLRLYWQKS